MKIVVIGGTGLVGRATVAALDAQGHEAVAASRDTGVDSVTGDGLDEALAGVDTLVDTTNVTAADPQAQRDFFTTSTRHLLAAVRRRQVAHYVALSIVGTPTLQQSSYFQAKLAQEQLIAAGGVRYTIVRATQFFEFLPAIADVATQGGVVHLPDAQMQPAAVADVGAALARIAAGAPADGVVEIAGPAPGAIATFVAAALEDAGDRRPVRPATDAAYFGATITRDTLLPGAAAERLPTCFADWRAGQPAPA